MKRAPGAVQKSLISLPPLDLPRSKWFPPQVLELSINLHLHKIGVSHSRRYNFTCIPLIPYSTHTFCLERSGIKQTRYFYKTYRDLLVPTLTHVDHFRGTWQAGGHYPFSLRLCQSNKRMQVAGRELTLNPLSLFFSGLPSRG